MVHEPQPFASACEAGITAEALGLTIPETLPATADGVIQYRGVHEPPQPKDPRGPVAVKSPAGTTLFQQGSFTPEQQLRQ